MRSGPRTPLLGVEAEFLGWGDGIEPVVADLTERGYTFEEFYNEHSYHCDCAHCSYIGNHGPIIPVMWKRQHDASLTHEGTEWISSPFPAIGPFMRQALDAIDIMAIDDLTSELQGRDTNRRDTDRAEAGLHVHCSINTRNRHSFAWTREFVRVMRGYAPEIFALTIPTELWRSNVYRSLNINEPLHPHRVFLNQIQPGHVEWRMFEPAYKYPRYMEAVFAITSTLTSLMEMEGIMSALDVVQSFHRWGNWNKEDELIDPNMVRDQFSPQRAVALLTALRSVTFDRSISDIAINYCEEAWEL